MASKRTDDTIPSGYPYFWSPESDTPLQDFLSKHKPSMVQDDGTKPWLWVSKSDALANVNVNEDRATEEAIELLRDATERVENIQNDSSIPIRSNKQKGLKSKKELREEVQSEATEKLKEISIRQKFVGGKWLIFAPPERVDAIWSTIANSLISGPLSATSAFRAKVATSPRVETPNYSHVLCLYMPDVYDRNSVTEVMKVLLRQHGLNVTGVKSDLYTAIGLDSKHASGISSTVWKNTALLKDSEIKSLKDGYFAELDEAKNSTAPKTVAAQGAKTGSSTKPKLKKKNDDPFASDDDQQDRDKGSARSRVSKNAVDASQKPVSTTGKQKLKPKSRSAFASDDDADEDDEEQERKAEVAAKKSSARAKVAPRKRKDSADRDDEGEQPAKSKRRI